jgi:hypothetical protein
MECICEEILKKGIVMVEEHVPMEQRVFSNSGTVFIEFLEEATPSTF